MSATTQGRSHSNAPLVAIVMFPWVHFNSMRKEHIISRGQEEEKLAGMLTKVKKKKKMNKVNPNALQKITYKLEHTWKLEI